MIYNNKWVYKQYKPPKLLFWCPYNIIEILIKYDSYNDLADNTYDMT